MLDTPCSPPVRHSVPSHFNWRLTPLTAYAIPANYNESNGTRTNFRVLAHFRVSASRQDRHRSQGIFFDVITSLVSIEYGVYGCES
jgi:hypothetical protein